MANEVEYRAIPDFPGYRVGDDGSVWTAWKQRSRGIGYGTASFIGDSWLRLRAHPEKKTGYLCVKLRLNSRQRHFRVHVLVLRVFVGPKPDGMVGCHKDDNPANNARRNLRWDTPAGNAADAERNGLSLKGERSPTARLTAVDVTEVKRRFAAGEMPEDIGPDFGITGDHVYAIARGRFWKSLVTEYDAACRERSRPRRAGAA